MAHAWHLASCGEGSEHDRRATETGLSESEHNERFGGHAPMLALAAAYSQKAAGPVAFNRQELTEILQVYGRKVAAGEWRDYAIDFLKDRAVFSVFRRSSETPLYRIEKDLKLARRQGAFSVISATGLILRRGHELEPVLRAIDKKLSVVN